MCVCLDTNVMVCMQIFMKGMGENVSEDEEEEEKKGSLTSERVGGAGGGFPVCLCLPSTVESPGGQQCL